jgi:cytoplasmic tRNA 2-thiolation protein 2
MAGDAPGASLGPTVEHSVIERVSEELCYPHKMSELKIPEPGSDIAWCKRCKDKQSVLTSRSEGFCASCFLEYIRIKVLKKLPSEYQPRNVKPGHAKTLLLPVSFGHSSLALFHILARQLERQATQSRKNGFFLHVLHVDRSLNAQSDSVEKLGKLKEMMPGFEYSTIRVEDIYQQDTSNETSNGDGVANTLSSTERLRELLDSLTSSSSREDVLQILFIRSIVSFAQAHECAGVLWGDSTSRLAERVMSETAKGRGFSLPWQLDDGETPYGIPFYFPSREVFRKELGSFLALADPDLAKFAEQSSLDEKKNLPKLASSNTIDLLLHSYFDSAEDSHPGLLSNVVRTSNRLEPKAVGMQRCKLCKMPVTKTQLGIESWKGIQNLNGDLGNEDYGLCYGCSRSVPRAAAELLPT